MQELFVQKHATEITKRRTVRQHKTVIENLICLSIWHHFKCGKFSQNYMLRIWIDFFYLHRNQKKNNVSSKRWLGTLNHTYCSVRPEISSGKAWLFVRIQYSRWTHTFILGVVSHHSPRTSFIYYSSDCVYSRLYVPHFYIIFKINILFLVQSAFCQIIETRQQKLRATTKM